MTARNMKTAGAEPQEFLTRSGPAEIILQILGSCSSTQDLLALISTCRHVRDVWQANVCAAIWPVWLREIPHFQDAVTAARMTQLVVDAERGGDLPPTRFSPGQLQHPQRPTLSELKTAFSLHRLSRAIAESFCKANLPWIPSDRPEGWSGAPFMPEEPDRMPEWNARVSQTIFRVLTLGAALAGTYREPLLKAREHPDSEVRALAERVVPRYYTEYQGEHLSLKDKELAFLMKFAVCDLEATPEAQDEVFGPVAEWLLDSILSDRESRQAMAKRFEKGYGRAGFCRSHENSDSEGDCPVGDLADGSGSHSDAHHVVWELMKVLWVAEQVCPDGVDEAGVLDRISVSYPSSALATDIGVDKNNQRPPESVVAVFFGMFMAEGMILPTPTAAPSGYRLIAHPAVHDAEEKECGNGKLPNGMSVNAYLDWIFDHSGRPNHVEDTDDPVPPLRIKFFEYFLRRYLKLCLHDTAFHGVRRRDLLSLPFEEFMECIIIFSHDDGENRCASDGELIGADFLDGSEMLRRYPSDWARFYQPRM